MKSLSIILEGERVKLVPLSMDHAEFLFECGRDENIWIYLPNIIRRIDQMEELIRKSLQMKDQGLEYPFAVFDRELDQYIGSTRFLNISLSNKNLEIGWTWYNPKVWRSRINTECKYLLLKYCFEEIQTVRVQFKADIRNDRSNIAIERIGAKKEGELRQDRIYDDGYIRNAYIYSIIDKEWPEIKEKLEEYLIQ